MTTTLLPEEVLSCILKLGSSPEFSAESHSLHRAIYRAKQNSEYASVLRVFRFSGSPVAPYSRVLENAFFNLQFSNKLRRFNPDLIVYSLTDDFQIYYHREVESKINAEPGLREVMVKLAHDVESVLKVEH